MAGTCCDLAFLAENPFDATMYLDLPSSGRVQVQVNGVSTEYTSAGVVTLSFVGGLNVIRAITSAGSVSLSGKLWGADGRTKWISLYPQGTDPFLVGGGVAPGSTADPAITPLPS